MCMLRLFYYSQLNSVLTNIHKCVGGQNSCQNKISKAEDCIYSCFTLYNQYIYIICEHFELELFIFNIIIFHFKEGEGESFLVL